jgi:hypothetical protein
VAEVILKEVPVTLEWCAVLNPDLHFQFGSFDVT